MAILVAGVAMASLTNEAYADKKAVKLTKEWSGSVEDENLKKDAPTVITTAKELGALWQSWKIEGKVPEVDFTKELVIVSITEGSKLKLGATLDDGNGNLEVLGMATRDIRPGFRYVIGTVSREGVKTVNGKKLP
jgi:hypothetical protein